MDIGMHLFILFIMAVFAISTLEHGFAEYNKYRLLCRPKSNVYLVSGSAIVIAMFAYILYLVIKGGMQ